MIDDGTCYRCSLPKWHLGPCASLTPQEPTVSLTTSLSAVIEENFKQREEIAALKAERDQWKMEAMRLRGAIANASAIIGGL